MTISPETAGRLPLSAASASAVPVPTPGAEEVTTLAEGIAGSTATENADLAPRRLTALVAALSSPELRDVLLIQWATTREIGERALAIQQRSESSADESEGDESSADEADEPSNIAAVLLGLGREPDPLRLDAALVACRLAAAHASEGRERAGALIACAWLSWAKGCSADARDHLTHAAREDARLSGAAVIRGLLDARMTPRWGG